ncbi:MAG: ribosomal protein S18-alanine N-acetyltransferase, partial [Candidatus Zixiibacteriota bacterium]
MSSTKKIDINSVNIRPMKSSELTTITLMEAQIFTDAWPQSAFIEFLEDSQNGILVAECNGLITGYAVYIFEMGEAHLANIAVAPEFRGKNIAKRLLNRILDIAKEAGCVNIFLDVRQSNAVAIEFYRKFGFLELYERPGYYQT